MGRPAGVVLGAWLLIGQAGCGGAPGSDDRDEPRTAAKSPEREGADRALAIADAYVRGYFDQFPEEANEVGYPDAPADRLSDRSPAALEAWHAREDEWLAELRAVDPAPLAGTPAEVPYLYALDRLEASVGRRVCRPELWNVSPTWTGWPEAFPGVLAAQPVGTSAQREAALARVRDVARYLDTEIENLRLGLETGFTAPRSNVEAVLHQVDALLALETDVSPFAEPALRADHPAFSAELLRVVDRTVIPSIRRYRTFLRGEYLSGARRQVGVSALPGGPECYEASVRFYTTVEMAPEQIHQLGLREMDRIQAEMGEIARRSFGTSDVSAALDAAREPPHTFHTREEILEYAGSAVDRARAAVPEWFGTVPRAEVVIREYPEFQQRTGGGFYSAGSPGEPGTYWIGTYAPATLSKAGIEATAFHEAYPGHHMQVSVVLESGGVHHVLKYFFNSGMGEGWALYTERLADEMGLYSGDIDRLGRLSNEALRAARLVVDPGMHALGWSRERAIDYMLANTAESREAVEYEVDRYLAVPGQATAYLIGSLEIGRLRADAERRLGERFDIRSFHDLVLEAGTITLPMLAARVERWIRALEPRG